MKPFKIRQPTREEYLAHVKSIREARAAATVVPEKVDDPLFIGTWQPKDRDGKSLGKIFNVFAAPQDLTHESGRKETFKYADAVKRIASLKNWNGFDGANHATDKDLYKALKSGTYDGGWIIPPRDLLCGTDADGKITQPDNLYALKGKGALKDTFSSEAGNGSVFPSWYWSSTEDRGLPPHVWNVRFSDGRGDWSLKDVLFLSCRPVRLVEVPRR